MTKTEIKPIAVSSKKSKTTDALAALRLVFPSDKNWIDLIQTAGLVEDQQQELRIILQHVIADLDQFRTVMEKMPPRNRLVGRLKRMEKLLGDVKAELKRGEKDLIHVLPLNTLEFLGVSMSFTAISIATQQNLYPPHVDLAIARAVNDQAQITVKDIESWSYQKRAALGLNHGDKLLKFLIDGIHEPLQHWIELDRKNKGGRTPQMLRRYLIYWLAYYCEEITGRTAKIAATGHFVELCEAVFIACGLPVRGLDKVIPDIVKKARSDRQKRESEIHNFTQKLSVFVWEPS